MNYWYAGLCIALLFIFGSSWSHIAAAQTPEVEGTLPDSVVVTATRLAEEARLSGRRVTVWTASDLRRLPVTSYDELLRTVAGLEVQSRGGFGVQSDLTMRGSTFNGVLVLLDGARLNDPMTGHFLADFPVPLAEIARIEVLRGPAAAMYGPDAIGGVVQLFTHAGLHAAGSARGLTGRVEGTVGRHSLYDARGAAKHEGERTLWSAAAEAQGSDGQAIRNEAGEAIRGSGGDLRTDFRREVASAAVSRAFNRAALYARAGVDTRDFNAFQFYSGLPSDTAREATTTLWAQTRLSAPPTATTPWTLQLNARQHDDTYIYNPQTPANKHTSRRVEAQAHASRALSPQLRVTGGVSGAVRGIDSNNMGRHQDASGGAFLTTRYQPTDRLTLNASGRIDADPGYGVEATPQVGIAYNREAFTLRGGISRAVRAPNYIERFFNTELASPRGRDLGNPDLRAERAWAYEAGVDVYPAAGFSLHATAFQRDTRDLIDFAQLTPADTVFLARNLLEVQTRGVELEAEGNHVVGPVQLRATASYTYLDASLGDVEESVTFKYALTNARHLVQGNLMVSLAPVQLGVQGLWKDPLDGDPYGVVDLRGAYHLPVGDRALQVTAEVRNVFDAAYTEIFAAPMPERWWLLGAQWRF
ncbi:MAG: TonB-dependent receptor [Bacteroidetes bacterium]|nr:TonB-dependent receptor [Bacteroidota bacterium]